MKQLYTTQEVADMLKVHFNTIHNFRKEGMPFKKIGSSVRFDIDEVMEWIESKNKEKEWFNGVRLYIWS